MLRGGKGLPAGGWSEVQAESAQAIRSLAQAHGERSVAVGGDVTDSVIVTGDSNTVQNGKYNVNIGKARGVTIGDGAGADASDDEDM